MEFNELIKEVNPKRKEIHNWKYGVIVFWTYYLIFGIFVDNSYFDYNSMLKSNLYFLILLFIISVVILFIKTKEYVINPFNIEKTKEHFVITLRKKETNFLGIEETKLLKFKFIKENTKTLYTDDKVKFLGDCIIGKNNKIRTVLSIRTKDQNKIKEFLQ